MTKTMDRGGRHRGADRDTRRAETFTWRHRQGGRRRARPLRALTPTVLASGSLTYESQVTLAPEVTGRVTEILVKEGDQVKRDQLLMRLDPRAPQAAIEQSEAQVRQARLSIERRQVDFDTLVAKVEALRGAARAGHGRRQQHRGAGVGAQSRRSGPAHEP